MSKAHQMKFYLNGQKYYIMALLLIGIIGQTPKLHGQIEVMQKWKICLRKYDTEVGKLTMQLGLEQL